MPPASRGTAEEGDVPRRISPLANISAHAMNRFECELPTAGYCEIGGDLRPANGGFWLTIYKHRASLPAVHKSLSNKKYRLRLSDAFRHRVPFSALTYRHE